MMDGVGLQTIGVSLKAGLAPASDSTLEMGFLGDGRIGVPRWEKITY